MGGGREGLTWDNKRWLGLHSSPSLHGHPPSLCRDTHTQHINSPTQKYTNIYIQSDTNRHKQTHKHTQIDRNIHTDENIQPHNAYDQPLTCALPGTLSRSSPSLAYCDHAHRRIAHRKSQRNAHGRNFAAESYILVLWRLQGSGGGRRISGTIGKEMSMYISIDNECITPIVNSTFTDTQCMVLSTLVWERGVWGAVCSIPAYSSR